MKNLPGKWFFLLLVLLFPLHDIHALDITITGAEIGFDFRPEYNRSFYYCQDFAIFGSIELNNRYMFKSGAALGHVGEEFDIKAFFSGRFTPLVGKNLNLSLAYIHYSIPGYQMRSHSILPYVSWDGRWAGFALGTNLRFTGFFAEPALFESMLSFSGYVNFLHNDRIVAGIKCANFYDFYAGNFGSYWFSIYGTLQLHKHWALFSELTIMQSGSVALSATFYGFAYRGGVRFIW